MKVERPLLFLPTVCPSVLVAFGDELLHEPVGCVRREKAARASAPAAAAEAAIGVRCFQASFSKRIVQNYTDQRATFDLTRLIQLQKFME